MQNNGHMFKVI